MLYPRILTTELARHPLTFLEVGAAGSLPKHWENTRPLLRILGFEPDAASFAGLPQTPRECYFNAALADAAKQVTFYKTKRPNVSSVYRPNHTLLQSFAIARDFEVVQTTTMTTTTLDAALPDADIHQVDFIQLDTQGSELSILHGGQQLLSHDVFGLEIEVEFAPLYENQPLFSEVDQFLRPLGFQLFDLRPQYFKRAEGIYLGNRQGQLLHADALYFRNIETYTTILNQLPDGERRHKIFCALLICHHYGYLDYAQEILSQLGAYISPQEKRQLAHWLRNFRALEQQLPDFPGRGRLYRVLAHLAARLRPPHPRGRLRRTLGNAQIDR